MKQVIERLYANSHILRSKHGQYADYGKVGCFVTSSNEDLGIKRTP